MACSRARDRQGRVHTSSGTPSIDHIEAWVAKLVPIVANRVLLVVPMGAPPGGVRWMGCRTALR